MREAGDRPQLRRRHRGVLQLVAVLIVAGTLPLVGTRPGVGTLQIAVWAVAVGLFLLAMGPPRLEPLMLRVGPITNALLIAWLVWMTGPASPYVALFVPLLGFVAIYRRPRVFAVTATVATVLALLPLLVEPFPERLVRELLVVALVVATLAVVNQLSARLQDASRLYRSIFDQHHGPAYVLRLDGRFETANTSTTEILGLDLSQLRDTRWQDVVADGEAQRLGPVFDAARAGEPQQFSVRTDAPGGRYLLQGSLLPIRRDQEVVAVCGVTEDVTDLRRAQFDAAALRKVMDQLTTAVALYAAEDRRLLYRNAAASGFSRGRDAGDGSPGWDELPSALVAEVPDDGDASVQVTYEPEGRRSAPLDVIVQRLQVDGTELIAFTGTDASRHLERADALRQVAEVEREAATQLRELDRMKNAFLTAVSHELRTPLTVVRGMAETLQRLPGELAPADRRRIERALVEQAERLSELLDDLLDVDRLARGRLRVAPARFDVVGVVRLAVTRSPAAGRVLLATPSALGAHADPIQVERMVANLLENAEKYAPGGEIDLHLAPLDGGGFRLEVSDRGPGIPSTELERVFEPFHRVDESHPRPGTGLGLALVAEFARLHGGSARAVARPGGGARLVVEVPDLPEEEPDAAAVEGASAGR